MYHVKVGKKTWRRHTHQLRPGKPQFKTSVFSTYISPAAGEISESNKATVIAAPTDYSKAVPDTR